MFFFQKIYEPPPPKTIQGSGPYVAKLKRQNKFKRDPTECYMMFEGVFEDTSKNT